MFAVCIFFFGTFYYNLKLHRIMGTITDYVDNNKTIVGVIANAPTITRDRVIYDVKALYIKENVHYKNVTGKIRVSTILDDNQSKYNYGDVIKFSGELKTPQGRRNPNGINYRAYLLQKGIVATAFSREIEIIGKQNTNPLMRAAFSMGQRLTDFYEANLPSNISSLMVGIALGIKDNIPRETMEAVKNGGVAHVLAVSGLHMGIIYAALNFLFSKFRFSNIFSFIIGSLTFVFYSIMAGLSPSVIRAAIMIMVFMLAKIVGRENDSLNTLCLSSTILLLLNPLTLFSVSFQLSYSAVLGIILFLIILGTF
ncbi:MAG: ComEC/Rec2 family competence protein [Tepidanaerobacteraceae bacterium]